MALRHIGLLVAMDVRRYVQYLSEPLGRDLAGLAELVELWEQIEDVRRECAVRYYEIFDLAHKTVALMQATPLHMALPYLQLPHDVLSEIYMFIHLPLSLRIQIPKRLQSCKRSDARWDLMRRGLRSGLVSLKPLLHNHFHKLVKVKRIFGRMSTDFAVEKTHAGAKYSIVFRHADAAGRWTLPDDAFLFQRATFWYEDDVKGYTTEELSDEETNEDSSNDDPSEGEVSHRE